MAEAFDPYLRWLGIRDPARPPNHYRLLGLDLFESDSDVIAVAADRQMAHVRTFQTGQFAPLSQRLLNELATARICLLKPEKKAVYDALLKKQLAAATDRTKAPAAGTAAQVSRPSADGPAAEALPDFAAMAAASKPTGKASSIATNRSTVAGRKRKSLLPWIGLPVTGVLLVIGVVVVQSRNEGSARDEGRVASGMGDRGLSAEKKGTVSLGGTKGVGAAGTRDQGPAKHPTALAGTLDKHAQGSMPSDEHGNRPAEVAESVSTPPVKNLPLEPLALPQKGVPPEPPVHPARNVALVDNPPQHNPASERRNSEISNPESEISNPKSGPKNPKSEIRNPKSNPGAPGQDSNPKSTPKPLLPPVPDKQAIVDAEKTILAVYKSDIEQANHGGQEAKAALAKQFVARGMETTDNPAARYALLTRAHDLAIAGGDVVAARECGEKARRILCHRKARGIAA